MLVKLRFYNSIWRIIMALLGLFLYAFDIQESSCNLIVINTIKINSK